MNLRIYLFLVAASLTAFLAHAQNATISGRLVDEQQQPLLQWYLLHGKYGLDEEFPKRPADGAVPCQQHFRE